MNLMKGLFSKLISVQLSQPLLMGTLVSDWEVYLYICTIDNTFTRCTYIQIDIMLYNVGFR